MLSKQSLPLIHASVPILREHGVAITELFYQKLLTAHSELKNLFNMGNQQSGEQQQALAAAVYAYAANIENPAALEPVLSRIAHKHASLGITPAQYTLVGKHLLAAIAEVLGDLASDDILAAWDEAYWLLAGDLIAREARLYHDHNIKAGEGWREMVVDAIEEEAIDTLSVYLKPANGEALALFSPGQYVSIAANIPEIGLQQMRQYSLSDAPGQEHWRVTVKKAHHQSGGEKAGGMISSHIHRLEKGAKVRVSPSYGDFILNVKSPSPVVLISAGVGVTPMVSMLNTLAKTSPQKATRFIYAARSADHHPLKGDLCSATGTLDDLESVVFYEHALEEKENTFSGYMDLGRVKDSILLDNADYYLCGPLLFMREQRRSLLNLGVPAEKIKYEVFGPDLLLGLQ